MLAACSRLRGAGSAWRPWLVATSLPSLPLSSYASPLCCDLNQTFPWVPLEGGMMAARATRIVQDKPLLS